MKAYFLPFSPIPIFPLNLPSHRKPLRISPLLIPYLKEVLPLMSGQRPAAHPPEAAERLHGLEPGGAEGPGGG